MQLIESTKRQKDKLFPLVLLALIQFIWILLYAIDKSVVFSIFHLSFSITGLIGLLGVGCMGFYLSANYINSYSGFMKHLMNSAFFVGYAMVAYFIGNKLFKFLFG